MRTSESPMYADSTMPWNQRSWIDTFWKNKALEDHLMNLILTKHKGNTK